MKTIGIICEYNPLHRGHEKQIQAVKQQFPGCAVVCLMSGNFVQRGAPAIFDKSLRAKAAVLAGADLVLELPVTYALASAEGFAAGGVSILAPFCDGLCFGSETGDREALTAAARALLSAEFPPLLRSELDTGKSFPAARAAALAKMGIGGDLLTLPNDILAVEYCKAIFAQGAKLEPLPIRREGSYHTAVPDIDNPSATAVRGLILGSHDWKSCIPQVCWEVFDGAPRHTPTAGELAMLARLRTMTDAEFEALPYGSEGLWRKFMHASRREATLEGILATTKSKRYTRTRIDRMAMCAFLGLTQALMAAPAPYARVLAFNDSGRWVLKEARKSGTFLNAGEAVDHPYWALEKRCGDLYGLFALDTPEPPGQEQKRRIFYRP